MNTKQKNFVRRKLIPFILREQGRGFGMSSWILNNMEPGSVVTPDSVARKVPICGTVACIGGSLDVLVQPRNGKYGDDVRLAKILGLPEAKVHTLFYGWRQSWPEPYKSRFGQRKTPLGKAKVAVELLKEVVRTNGACLEDAY